MKKKSFVFSYIFLVSLFLSFSFSSFFSLSSFFFFLSYFFIYAIFLSLLYFIFEYVLKFYYNIYFEFLFTSIVFISFYLFEFNLFLIFLIIVYLFFRIKRLYFYSKIVLFSFFTYIYIFFTFQLINISEVYLSNYFLSNSKNQFYVKNNKIIRSKNYLTEFRIPKNLYFHPLYKLKKIDHNFKIGSLKFILSSSEVDTTFYPLIKVFKVDKSSSFNTRKIEDFFLLYLDSLKENDLIDELQKIKSKNSKIQFWTFYDKIRPRYSKIGFVLYENKGELYFIQIIENLKLNQEHETVIKEFLKFL